MKKSLNLKTLLVSAAMALAMIVAPASASASEWLKDGSSFEGEEALSLSGTLDRQRPFWNGSGFSTEHLVCPFTADLTLYGGSEEALMTSFDMNNVECEGTGGTILSGCEVYSDGASVPWFVHIGGTQTEPTIVAEEVGFIWNTNCPTEDPGFFIYQGSLEFQLDNSEEISGVEFAAEGHNGHGDWKGSAEVSPAGTFGIG